MIGRLVAGVLVRLEPVRRFVLLEVLLLLYSEWTGPVERRELAEVDYASATAVCATLVFAEGVAACAIWTYLRAHGQA